ncbi:unnamed protein product, partial [Mesorhabditis belari]|uniref:Uncharacterized protein n=1 Tax=Mesorhabditis belari TaxID=2138241 RepID=A0AAF3FRD0_9BILA
MVNDTKTPGDVAGPSNEENKQDELDIEQIDLAELEKRRDFHLRKLVKAEQHFMKLKPMLQAARYKELEIRRALALNHDGKEFLERKADLDREHQQKKELMMARYCLGIHQLERKRLARKNLRAEPTEAESRARIVESLRDSVRERLESMQMGHAQKNASKHYIHRTLTEQTELEERVARQKKLKMWTEMNLRKPIVVTSLDAISLQEDLKLMDKALADVVNLGKK